MCLSSPFRYKHVCNLIHWTGGLKACTSSLALSKFLPFCRIHKQLALSPGWHRSWPGNRGRGWRAEQSISLAPISRGLNSSEFLKTPDSSWVTILPFRWRGISDKISASCTSAGQVNASCPHQKGTPLMAMNGLLHPPMPLQHHSSSQAFKPGSGRF